MKSLRSRRRVSFSFSGAGHIEVAPGSGQKQKDEEEPGDEDGGAALHDIPGQHESDQITHAVDAKQKDGAPPRPAFSSEHPEGQDGAKRPESEKQQSRNSPKGRKGNVGGPVQFPDAA